MRFAQLGELTELITKGTTPTTLGMEFCDSGHPFLRVQNLRDGRVDLNADSLFISSQTHRALARSVVRPRDLLISIAGTIGRVAEVPENSPEMNCNQAVAIIRLNEKAFRRYVYHALGADSTRKQLRLSEVTGTITNLSLGELTKVRIPLPPLPEQRRIAAILDHADALRAKRRAAIAKLDSLAQSIFLDMFGDPAANPHNYPRRTLGEIIEFVGGSQPPKSTFTYEPAPDSIRLVQIRDFRTDAFPTYIPRKQARRFFSEDDVMIGRYGPPVFQIFRGLSGSYNVALMKALPKSAEISRDFIFYLLQERRLTEYVVANSERTAGQSGVNLSLLEQYPAFAPPLQLQNQFSAAVRRVSELTQRANRQAGLSEALFATLQHRAFQGTL